MRVMTVVVVVMAWVVMAARGGREILPGVLWPTEALVWRVVMVMVMRISNERFHRVLRRKVQGFRVDVMLVVGNPVEVLQLCFPASAWIVVVAVAVVVVVVVVDTVGQAVARRLSRTRCAEAGGGGHGGTRRAERGGGQGAGREAMAVAFSFGRLLLYLELHEVEVVNILDGQRTVWQLCAHGEIGGHVSPCDTRVGFFTGTMLSQLSRI